jgi:type VI secretion system protein ImpC
MTAAAAPVPAPQPASRDDQWDQVIRAIVAPHIVPRPDPRQPDVLRQLDDSAGRQMRDILHHPEFQSLESAWRSLFLLVRRLETGEDLQLSIVDAGRPDLAAISIEEPFAVCVTLYQYSDSEAEVNTLLRLGDLARRNGGVIIGAAEPGEGAQWLRLRRHALAPWIGLAWPRFLLRLPYGENTSSTDLFDFEEMPQPPEHAGYLWGNPAVAAACLLGEAVSRGGRPGSILELDGMPVHTWREDGESVMQPCAERWMTESDAAGMLSQGVMPLASLKGRDAVRLVGFRSVADPPAPLRAAWS